MMPVELTHLHSSHRELPLQSRPHIRLTVNWSEKKSSLTEGTLTWQLKSFVWVCVFHYLYKEDNEKIEVGYPSELLKQILRDKIPNRVLKEKEQTTLRMKTKSSFTTVRYQNVARFAECSCKNFPHVKRAHWAWCKISQLCDLISHQTKKRSRLFRLS